MSINSVDAWYCTREDVERAQDVAQTARSIAQIDRLIGEVSRQMETDLGRIFYPLLTTRKFDWPPLPTNGAYPWRLWLNQYELISIQTLVSGGVTIGPSSYLLEPVNEGPPYNRVEINLGTNASFASGASWQQSLVITGLYGYDDVQNSAGTLAAAMSDATTARLDLSDSSQVGVGSILIVEGERVRVVGRQQLATGATISADLAAQASATFLTVSDGTKITINEVITIDAERMLVVDVIGNTVVVKRSWDGSVLAAHSNGAGIFAGRRMLLATRGDFGTVATAHSNGTAVTVQRIGPRSLCVEEVVWRLGTEQAGMQRSSGSGDSQSNVSPALADARAKAANAFGRQARFRTL